MSGKTDLGTVQIHHKVIGTIATLAAKEVPGVCGVTFNPFKSVFGAPAVRVETQDQDVQIWLSLTVEYGVDLPSVGIQVQERVRERVEQTTHLNPTEVNVSIHHIKAKEREKS